MNERPGSIESASMDPWLQQLRHDLVKRALWAARDLRTLLAEGGEPTAADLASLRAGLLSLRAPDGAPCDAVTLLARLRETAPEGLANRLKALAEAVAEAQRAVQRLGSGGLEKSNTKAPRKPGAGREALEQALAALFEVERGFEALATTAPVRKARTH